MRTTSTRETFLHILIAINLMLSVTLTRGTVRVSAQTGCPPSNASGARFPANTSLTVYLDPAFSATQRDGIMAGLAGWTSANGSTGNASGIVVDHVIIGTLTGTLPANTIQVMQGTPSNGVRANTQVTISGTTIVSATITIDARVTNQSAIQEVSDHEGGHALMGLYDSPSSVPETGSIMAHAPYCSSDAAVASDPSCNGIANYNALRPLSAPTNCDQLAAKANGNYGNPSPPQPNPPASSGTGSRPDQSFWTGYNPQARVCYQWFQVTTNIICSSSRGCTVQVDYSAIGSPICY
jgi:hypothetical protein